MPRPGPIRVVTAATGQAPPERPADRPVAVPGAPPTTVAARRQGPDATDLPPADPFALAHRLLQINPPHTVNAAPPEYGPGRQDSFWLENIDATQAYQTRATLRYRGQHAYLYLEDGLGVSDAELARAGQDFDTLIYPLLTTDVALPELPGIDADPRVTILVADLHGAGGYFTQLDNEPLQIVSTSNERKIIYIDLGSARPGSNTFDGYVAHEFQHLVHYTRNHNGQAWINEGMSEVFREQITHGLLNIPKYEIQPDTQLNDFPTIGDDAGLPHYGAAHSFLRYLLQHYGGIEQAGTLAAEPGDGIAEVRAYLKQGGYGLDFDDVFADWLVANLLNDPAGGRFSQNNAAIGVQRLLALAAPSETDATVHQWGANYYTLEPGGRALSVDVQGAPTVAAIPTSPHSGSGMWWSRRGDAIDSTLTRAVDLSRVDHATLQFATWYDIERDYDFGYLEVSTDNGQSWTALKTAHSTDRNPFGIALGPAYSGHSGSDRSGSVWIDETADLTPFAGRRILLRFEYVTDESANRNGWALDDLRIPEIGFADDAETDGDWVAAGFERLTGPLPQHFIVQAVLTGNETTVQRLPLDEQNHATLAIPAGTRHATLIVSGATDLIRTQAGYHLSVRP